MRTGFGAASVLLLAVSCWSQSAKRVEVFGGYSFAAKDFTGGTLYNGNTSLSRGWNASANFRLNPFSQLVGDFGGYYLPVPFCGSSPCRSHVHTLMFGPQFSLRHLFGHALFGLAVAGQSGAPSSLVNNDSFVMALGGGWDHGLTCLLGVRAQADYLRTNFTNGDDQVHFKNNNVRIAAGLFVRW